MNFGRAIVNMSNSACSAQIRTYVFKMIVLISSRWSHDHLLRIIVLCELTWLLCTYSSHNRPTHNHRSHSLAIQNVRPHNSSCDQITRLENHFASITALCWTWCGSSWLRILLYWLKAMFFRFGGGGRARKRRKEWAVTINITSLAPKCHRPWFIGVKYYKFCEHVSIMVKISFACVTVRASGSGGVCVTFIRLLVGIWFRSRSQFPKSNQNGGEWIPAWHSSSLARRLQNGRWIETMMARQYVFRDARVRTGVVW